MLLGRLELFTVLVLLLPSFWRGLSAGIYISNAVKMFSDLRFERPIKVLHHPLCQLKPKSSRAAVRTRLPRSSGFFVFAQRRLPREGHTATASISASIFPTYRSDCSVVNAPRRPPTDLSLSSMTLASRIVTFACPLLPVGFDLSDTQRLTAICGWIVISCSTCGGLSGGGSSMIEPRRLLRYQ